MSRIEDRRKYFLYAFSDLAQEGREWSPLAEVGMRAAEFDENYLQRRAALNNLLGKIGIKRNSLPNGHKYPPRSTPERIVVLLEQESLVEGQFDTAVEAGENPHRRYRLVTPDHHISDA